jgi:small subunit ribosomal protein S17
MSHDQTKVRKSRPVKCVVTSASMAKSRVGAVERLIKHPRFGKYVRRRTKLMFHDENNVSQVGDEVLIEMSRPLSKRKRFALLKVKTKAKE